MKFLTDVGDELFPCEATTCNGNKDISITVENKDTVTLVDFETAIYGRYISVIGYVATGLDNKYLLTGYYLYPTTARTV